KTKPHAKTSNDGNLEGALHAREEDSLLDRGRDVGVVDDLVGVADLDDAADERGLELAAEQLAFHLDAERRDADDGELTVKELADVDLDAVDGAREREAGDALDPRDARGQGEDEVGGVGGGISVRTLDADRDALYMQAIG